MPRWAAAARSLLNMGPWKAPQTESQDPKFSQLGSGEPLPILPVEIWTTVLRFAVRLHGSLAEDLPDYFSNCSSEEGNPDPDPGLPKDRAVLIEVCSAFRNIVTEISMEYMLIRSEKDLEHFANLAICVRHTSDGQRLGDLARRIDLHILGHYKVQHLSTLLQYTPNLLTFRICNGGNKEVLARLPRQTMAALMMHGRNLRRIDFASPAEAPSLQDLVDISRNLHFLKTLHLLCIHSYPIDRETIVKMPTLRFSSLETLSLGLIPEIGPIVPPTYSMTWDPLVALLSKAPAQQLPNLHRLETDIFPSHAMHFFTAHGHKLHTLRTTTWTAADNLPTALKYCPNLKDLILSHCGGHLNFTVPTHHPTIQRLCIAPMSQELSREAPDRIFRYVVVDPVDELLQVLEKFDSPAWSELRIKNTGTYTGLHNHHVWLNTWWRRWNIRGVVLCDKDGVSYRDTGTEGELALNNILESKAVLQKHLVT
ncbi:hypothetical protein FA15DRAFT_674305 [Coprinopsis marcescibilis]|uniref:F-box domain-containing protein n=1 Tax=Coprinopsis marcescibilis TaxID=230819 RepID=A0A5C3KHJ7_COPMA|nr:hypothetical protein FA15DRAFT_674305 [Coprinopsis marcescibilis]